ncbi:MAG: acetolactate synthase [Oscillospiraceae bacterium]|nr:acetolactate synthase [Oscillospiraceae bacterium]
MTIEQLSVFLENKPGKLAEALESLAAAGIDLRALSLADSENFGILRIIVDKPARALKILQDEGYGVELVDVIPVAVDDEPGKFAAALRVLADAGVAVEYTYVFVAPKAGKAGKAYAVICADDAVAAVRCLESNGVDMLTSEEMYNL